MKNIKNIYSIMLLVLLLAGIAQFASATVSQGLIVSLVNQDPDPAVAGDIVELRLGLENVGDTQIKNMVFELIEEYPFEIVTESDGIEEVSTIDAYQTGDNMKIIRFKVKVNRDANAGTYDLKLKYYEKGSSSTIEKSIPIDIESTDSAEVIYIDQVELIPGKITPLEFTINNVGSAPLRDLSFKWENAEDIILPVGSDNTKYIKYIDVGDGAKLKFNVIASAIADPDLYKLDLTLNYDDPLTGEAKELNTKAGVYVGGATDFDAAFSGVSSGEASFSISNIGSVSASSVTVRIPDQEGWRVTGSNSVIIGNLNEGDYTIASFTLSQTSSRQFTQGQTQQKDTETAPTNRAAMEDPTIDIEIIYTDSRGNRNTLTKEVAVDPSAFRSSLTSTDGTASNFAAARMRRTNPLQQIWNTGRWILLGVIIIVLIILANREYKKGRLKDPNYTYKKMFKELTARFKKKKDK